MTSRETKPIRVLYADDEPLGRSTLRSLLSGDAEVEIVAECANGSEALLATREHQPDVLFLDVQMPGLTGIDVASELAEEERPVIVFVTAYDQYAIEAFDVHAVDYLLKPFDDERFETALDRAKQRVRLEGSEPLEMSALLEQLDPERAVAESEEAEAPGEEGYADRISVHSEGRVALVDVAELIWVESADQYVKLHSESGEVLMRASMASLEKRLDPAVFFRVHRSAIVRLDRLRAFESQGAGGRVDLAGHGWLPVSRSRVARLRKLLG